MSNYTSLYLDSDSAKKLGELAAASDQSKSQVIRGLIRAADGKQHVRLAKIVSELNSLVGSF